SSGHGSRGGLDGCKRRNDDEADSSSLRPPVSERRREQARTHDAKSRSAGVRVRRPGGLCDPSIQRLRAVERAWWEVKEAAATEDAVAAARLPALREEYQLASTLSGTLIYNTLHDNEPPPREDDSGDDDDFSEE
ncbi:hypothetical protein KGF37_19095, partial [Clostridioides sp. ZZV14-6105]|nr:hypothetical protein [Clostridioides sp. ZZV14-6105]